MSIEKAGNSPREKEERACLGVTGPLLGPVSILWSVVEAGGRLHSLDWYLIAFAAWFASPLRHPLPAPSMCGLNKNTQLSDGPEPRCVSDEAGNALARDLGGCGVLTLLLDLT